MPERADEVPANAPARSSRRASSLPLAEMAVLIIAFALRAWRLGDKSIWWDEGLAVWALRKPFLETTLWTAGDVHPPLFFWTLWPWLRAAGQSEYALRFITLIWGLLVVLLGLVLARRLGGRGAGLASGLLLALSPLEVWWSTELRMYMLAGLCVMAAALAALRWTELAVGVRSGQDAARRWLAAYLLAALAAVHTVYLTGVAIAAINLALLWAALRRRLSWPRYAGWFGVQLALVLLFLPWWALATHRMQSWTSIQDAVAPGFVLELGATLLATGRSVDLGHDQAMMALFWSTMLAAAALALRSGAHREAGVAGETGVNMLGLFLILPPLAIWAATQPRSLFYAPNIEARYFLPFAAPVFVLAGWLVNRAWQRHRLLGAVLLAGLLLPQLAGLPDFYAERRLRDDYKSMVLAIWTQYEPGDVVLLSSGERYPIFRYHYDRPWDRPRGADGPADWVEGHLQADRLDGSDRPELIPFPSRANKPLGQNDWQDRLERIVAAHDRVWLAEVERHHQDPEGRILAWLGARMTPVASEAYGPDALHLFGKEDRAPRLMRLSTSMPGLEQIQDLEPAEAADPLRALVGMPARRLMPGDVLHLTTFEPAAAEGHAPSAALQVDLERRPPDDWSASLWGRDIPGDPSGEARRRLVSVSVTERLPAGDYAWALLDRPTGLARSAARAADPDRRRTPDVSVLGSPPSPPAGPIGAAVDFEGLRLIELRIPQRVVRPGSPIFVDLRWAEEPEARSLQDPDAPVVFAHLVGPATDSSEGPLRVTGDGPAGILPERSDRGQPRDRHLLHIPTDAPAGAYHVAIGLYDRESGVRRIPRDALGPGQRRDAALSLDPSAGRLIYGPIHVRPYPALLELRWSACSTLRWIGRAACQGLP